MLVSAFSRVYARRCTLSVTNTHTSTGSGAFDWCALPSRRSFPGNAISSQIVSERFYCETSTCQGTRVWLFICVWLWGSLYEFVFYVCAQASLHACTRVAWNSFFRFVFSFYISLYSINTHCGLFLIWYIKKPRWKHGYSYACAFGVLVHVCTCVCV